MDNGLLPLPDMLDIEFIKVLILIVMDNGLLP